MGETAHTGQFLMVFTSDGRNQANRGGTKLNESWQIGIKPNEQGKTGQKNGHFQAKKKRAKRGKKRGKNGQTKPDPGKTGQNRKFRRNLVWVRSSLVFTGQWSRDKQKIIMSSKCYREIQVLASEKQVKV